MIKDLSAENMVNFLDTCIKLEKEMTAVLEKWSSDVDIAAVLEEYPYLDESTATLYVLEEGLKNTFAYADTFADYSNRFFNGETSTPVVLITNYFKSPAVVMIRELIKTGVTVDDDVLMELKGQFEKTDLNIRHYICRAFDLHDYPNGNGARVFESYESQYGSIKEYVASILAYCDDHPMFYGESVTTHYDFFMELLARNQEVNKEEFIALWEAVMPWDIELLKSGQLPFDANYIKKLDNRVNNPCSIYNDVPIIRDVIDKLPKELYMKMYIYEDLISLASIELIKAGKLTFEALLEDCRRVQYTSLF